MQRVIEKCKGFIPSLESAGRPLRWAPYGAEDHHSWAKERLRPWTPPSRRPVAHGSCVPCMPRPNRASWVAQGPVARVAQGGYPQAALSSPVSPGVRPRLGRKQRVWARTGFHEGPEPEDEACGTRLGASRSLARCPPPTRWPKPCWHMPWPLHPRSPLWPWHSWSTPWLACRPCPRPCSLGSAASAPGRGDAAGDAVDRDRRGRRV